MKKILIWVYFVSTTFQIYTQELMTVGTESVTVSEFKRIYEKNNRATNLYSRKDLDEYVDLFTLFKMKLQEARRLKLDTLPVVRDDYAKYTDQLVQNTLVDKNYIENILKSQYEHMKYDVKVAHIMVKCAAGASPQDSLLAYNKIKFLKEKLTKENFEATARESSEDKSSSSNGGVLGYITAFMTTPDFEEQCYTTPVGQISTIFRTQFGYHILYIIDKRVARGRVKIAHIYMKTSEKNDEEKKMNEAYQALSSKKLSFDEAVKKYSEDASTKEKNGELPEFGVSEMVQGFEDQCFALKNNGDISKPFKTEYGWHLVKLLEKKPVQSYESSKEFIKQRMERDPRINNLKGIAYDLMKKKYGYKESPGALVNWVSTISDTFFVNGGWKIPASKSTQTTALFTFDNQPYTIGQFVEYANKNFSSATSRNKMDVVRAMSDAFTEKIIWESTKKRLSRENDEFRGLESEYMNGLLIFEVMDKEIWKKAVLDTNGAKALYEKVKNDYWYKERYLLEGVKTIKSDLVNSYFESMKSKTAKSIYDAIKKSKDSNDFVYYEKTIEKGEYPLVDAAASSGTKAFVFNDDEKSTILSKIVKFLPPSIKPYNEIRGRVQNLYQTQLEKEWNASLRAKYPVKINEAEMNKLIKN